jgi:hypothetical protein
MPALPWVAVVVLFVLVTGGFRARLTQLRRPAEEPSTAEPAP